MKLTSVLVLSSIAAMVTAMNANAHSGKLVNPSNTDNSLVEQIQITLPFGTSNQRVRRALRQQGYDQIDVTKLGFTSARAEACKGSVRYALKISPRGNIKSQKRIGRCRPVIDIDRAVNVLEQEGYRRIDMREESGIPYVATACRRGDKYELHVSAYGDVRVARDLGSCRKAIAPADVRAQLRKDGYNRIKFTDDTPPRYRVEACRNGRRLDLRIGRRGQIRDERRIGRCSPPIEARQIGPMLEKAGYDRIEITDRRLPRYAAEACRRDTRYELIMNRFGDVRRERKIGNCPLPISERDLVRKLRRSDFRKISVTTTARDEYQTIACRGDDRMQIRFSKYGEVIDQDRLGTCVSPRLEEVIEKFERGMNRVTVHVEGCRRGRRVRITLNEFGKASDPVRIGRCLRR